MITIPEGSLKFHFPNDCRVGRYEKWAFYRNQFQSVATRSKAIDMVYVTDDVCWLVEIKDYRKCPRSKPISIEEELATKVRDALAGLASAAKNANDCKERELARQTLAGSRRWRVVLHLEQPSTRTRLRPKPIDPASVLQKLRSKMLKAVDPHPIVCDRKTLPHHIPWSVE